MLQNRIDKVLTRWIGALPDGVLTALESFDCSVPENWKDLTEQEQLQWLESNRENAVHALRSTAHHVELLANLVDHKISMCEIGKLKQFVTRFPK